MVQETATDLLRGTEDERLRLQPSHLLDDLLPMSLCQRIEAGVVRSCRPTWYNLAEGGFHDYTEGGRHRDKQKQSCETTSGAREREEVG